MEDCITTYGCTDGIPLYLNQFEPEIGAFENIKNNFFRKDALLYGESDFLLRQEFREPANYFAILKAISFGSKRKKKGKTIVMYFRTTTSDSGSGLFILTGC